MARCSNNPQPAKQPATAKIDDKSAEDKASAKAESKPFKFADQVEPFTPPKLDEIDKTAQWTDRPVVDALKLLQEKLAKEKPQVSVAEALHLKNDSKENNEKILGALGRLPANDRDVNWDAEINRHGYGDVNSTNPILTSPSSSPMSTA